MVEWFKAAVLKTAVAQVTEGSNPSLSAICIAHDFAWILVRMSRKVVFYFLLSISHFTGKYFAGKYVDDNADRIKIPIDAGISYIAYP